MNSFIHAVERSTMKRVCRNCGIRKWPSNKRLRETTQDQTNTESNQHLHNKGEISRRS